MLVLGILTFVTLACGVAHAETPAAFPSAPNLPSEPVTRPWITQADVTHRRLELFTNVTYLGWAFAEGDNHYNASLRIGPGYFRRSHRSVVGIYPSYQIDRVSVSTFGLNAMMMRGRRGGYVGGFVDLSSGKFGGLVSGCVVPMKDSDEGDRSTLRACLEVQVRDTEDGPVVAVSLSAGFDVVGVVGMFRHLIGRD
jgi:hypothetical protein